MYVSALKLQLQSSFEMEDSNPEEQSTSPDTPVVVVAPDQLVAPADAQQITPMQENVQTGSPNYPMDVFLDINCPLSETLRNLRLETLGYPLAIIFKSAFFRHFDLADAQGWTGIFLVTLLSAVSWVNLGFRLLSQLNEKEREYQELLRSSVCSKQEQIDALRTAAAATKGKMFVQCWGVVVVLQMKAPLNATFIYIMYECMRVRNIRSVLPCKRKTAW